MKRTLHLLALLIALLSTGLWVATGAHRGWTKTSVETKTIDDVTGLEAISYKRRFVPGVDFLGATLLGASLLAVVSLLLKNKQPKTDKTNQ